MGYFDALTSGSFKTTSDGRKLFFPWGFRGKGYVIASEPDYQRLRRQFQSFNIIGLVLILGAGTWQGPLWALAVGVLLIVFYVGWARYLRRGLQPSNESLSLNESMATQARTHSGWVLWLLTVVALVFVSLGIVILIVAPRDWLTAVLAIGFFGLCLAVFLRMLVLRRRGAENSR